jgi:anti-sigma B factor antagonist
MALKCDVRTSGDVTILDLAGVLTMTLPSASVPKGTVVLGEKVAELIQGGRAKILLNFAGVTYIDSNGVGQLVGAYTSARHRGAELKLSAPTRDVRKVLELTQLVRVFDVRDDEADAIAAFAKGSVAAA